MRRLLVFLALTALVAACGDSTSPKKPSSPVGSWALATLDGNPPPIVVDTLADTTFFFDGSKLTLGQDGRFSEVFALRLAAPGWDSTFAQTDTGTWAIKGTTITFNVIGATPDESGTYLGEFRDSTIVESGADEWVYRRQ